MKVVDWISYDDAKEREECGIGGMGGWFGMDQRHSWEDYVDIWFDEAKPYVIALRDSIVERGIRESGDWHQDSDEGVPLFEDGTVATYSFRAWGDLLAAVWEGVDRLPYCYMDFYYSGSSERDGFARWLLTEDAVGRRHFTPEDRDRARGYLAEVGS